jgi:opacity protein-like surface antigen
MRSKSVTGVLAAIAVGTALLVPSLAAAQSAFQSPPHDNYFAVKFGPYFPGETNGLDAVGNTFKQGWPTKYQVDGAIGHYWDWFGLQFSAGYLTTGNDDFSFKTWPVLLTAKVRLPIGGFMAPYGEGGAGVGISSVSGIGGADQTKAGFAAIAGAGVEFYLGQFLVGADLKYLWLDPKFSAVNAPNAQGVVDSFKFNGITVQGYVGFLW